MEHQGRDTEYRHPHDSKNKIKGKQEVVSTSSKRWPNQNKNQWLFTSPKKNNYWTLSCMVNLNKEILCGSVEGIWRVLMHTRWKDRIHTLGYQLPNDPLPSPIHEKCTKQHTHTECKAKENNYNCVRSYGHKMHTHCILNADKRLCSQVEEKI